MEVLLRCSWWVWPEDRDRSRWLMALMIYKQYWLCCLFSKINGILLSFTARQPRENWCCRDTPKDYRTQWAFWWPRQNSLQDSRCNWYRLSAGGVNLISTKWVLMRTAQPAAQPFAPRNWERSLNLNPYLKKREKFYSHHHQDPKCWSKMLIRQLQHHCSNTAIKTSSYASRIFQVCPLLKDIFLFLLLLKDFGISV